MIATARSLAIAAAAATGVQVGAAIVASRAALPDLGPTVLALLRYAIGAAILLPIAWRIAAPRVARRDLLPVAALGIGQFGILIALMNFALQTLPSGLVALIFATLPIQTLIVAAALGRETLTMRKLFAAILTTLGVGLALSDGPLAPTGNATLWIGVAAALASATTGALCSVLYRPFLERYPTVQVSFLAMLASVVFLVTLAPLDPPPIEWSNLTAAPWGLVLFVGASSGVGYLTWLYALKVLPATDVTLFLALSPLTAATLGSVLLDEPVSAGLIAGFVLVTAGMWIALRSASPTCPASQPRSNCSKRV